MRSAGPPEGDPFEVCCFKFGLDPVSRNGVSVAHVTIERLRVVPIYSIAAERLSEAAMAERIAAALGFTIDEVVDFLSCNMDPPTARELIKARRPV